MISERLMAIGGWSLTFREDTPREVLDVLVPFSTVCITTGRVDTRASDTSLLAQMRYVGVVFQPGPQLTVGGYGLAALLGDADGKCYDMLNSAQLPENDIAFSGTDLSFWLDDICAGSGLTPGTNKTVNLAGGPFQWTVTPREVLSWAADKTGTEWRVNTDLTVDLDDYTTLYGSTPTAFITSKGQGREIEWASVEGRFSVTVDVEDYCSKVIVLGPGGSGSSGGASPYYGVSGGELMTVRKVVEMTSGTAGSESAVAASILGLYNGERRQAELTTDLFDVNGEIGVGSLVYLWDQATGLYDLTADSVAYRGRQVQPLTVRCTGLDWPVRRGMGVYARWYDPDAAAYQWTNVSDYVLFEEGESTIQLGANRRWSER